MKYINKIQIYNKIIILRINNPTAPLGPIAAVEGLDFISIILWEIIFKLYVFLKAHLSHPVLSLVQV